MNQKSEQELFLSTYNIEDYDRPSVATDIVAFTMQDEPNHHLALLLIRRGEHPFKNQWALPGGFLRADETLEECALREMKEETGLIPVAMMPVGTYSNPDRDPRGRVVSNAYVSVISQAKVNLKSSNDAIDARWFDVDFTFGKNQRCILTLSNGDEILKAKLKKTKNQFGRSYFEVTSNEGLAFDHAKMIASALLLLRSESEKLDVVFDFLPKKFTLTEMQRVQETLLGTTLLTANYRRKIAGYVEETEEYTEGASHRPARLFRRKKL